MFNSVNKFDMTDISKKGDSVHCCLADMDLASASLVCSSALGLLKNDLEDLLMPNIPFLNPSYTSGCVLGSSNRLLWYLANQRA